MKEYSTLHEAMAALENGKVVSYYDHQLQITFDKDFPLDVLALNGKTFEDLFNGTWVIEN